MPTAAKRGAVAPRPLGLSKKHPSACPAAVVYMVEALAVHPIGHGVSPGTILASKILSGLDVMGKGRTPARDKAPERPVVRRDFP